MSEMEEFIQVIRQLRAPDGCPWDREQTHESLRECMIEEAYEVVDAIDHNDMANLREELGDVLLQVVMHSVMAEEEKAFTMDDVIREVKEKMIRRHPHVFGDVSVDNSGQVLANWDEIKKGEKQETTYAESMVRIPRALPANMRAAKVQKKAAKVGFDFADADEVMEKVYEELDELQQEVKNGNTERIEEEFGDVMFSIINLSRFLQINAENSLTNAVDKFINRFVDIENIAKKSNKDLKGLTIDEMNDLWECVKRTETK